METQGGVDVAVQVPRHFSGRILSSLDEVNLFLLRSILSQTSLTLMSGWLPFLSLELLAFIPQILTVLLPEGEV